MFRPATGRERERERASDVDKEDPFNRVNPNVRFRQQLRDDSERYLLPSGVARNLDVLMPRRPEIRREEPATRSRRANHSKSRTSLEVGNFTRSRGSHSKSKISLEVVDLTRSQRPHSKSNTSPSASAPPPSATLLTVPSQGHPAEEEHPPNDIINRHEGAGRCLCLCVCASARKLLRKKYIYDFQGIIFLWQTRRNGSLSELIYA